MYSVILSEQKVINKMMLKVNEMAVELIFTQNIHSCPNKVMPISHTHCASGCTHIVFPFNHGVLTNRYSMDRKTLLVLLVSFQ